VAVSRVIIGGRSIGITGLEDVFREVRSEGIRDIRALKDLILKKIKAMNYIPSSAESTYREDLYEEYLVFTGDLSERKRSSRVVEVRLYGSSCYNCEKLDSMVRETLSRTGTPVDYDYVTDMREIARAGILSTPALAVGGTVIIKGRVPEEDKLERMLLQAIEKTKSSK
jgi:small redox-active disulfide protein 2